MDKKSKSVRVSEAHTNLGEQIKSISDGEPVQLERYGKPVAGLVSVDDLKLIRQAKSQTQVLMAFNHAGGASKTSSIRDIGHELSRRGFKVLLIDLDPQANLSNWLGLWEVEEERSIRNSLETYEALPEPYEVHGLHLIPSTLGLAETDARLPGMTNPEGRLREILQPIREAGTYDLILIDCPPALGKLTANAANAADWVIVPIPAKYKGLQALEGVQSMLREYTRTNAKLRVAMYLVTQKENTKHSNESLQTLKIVLGLDDEQVAQQNDIVLGGPITWRPAVYNTCQPESQPVGVYAPESDAHQEIKSVADVLLSRIGMSNLMTEVK